MLYLSEAFLNFLHIPWKISHLCHSTEIILKPAMIKALNSSFINKEQQQALSDQQSKLKEYSFNKLIMHTFALVKMFRLNFLELFGNVGTNTLEIFSSRLTFFLKC